MKKQNKGFTLIELMVVVAIIGILAAVAVPRFLRFMAQSRRTETKTILSAVYVSESAVNEGLNYQASQAAATVTGYTDLLNAGFTPASPIKLYTNAANGFATCDPSVSPCVAASQTYNSHVSITLATVMSGASVRGSFFSAHMCGDPDIDGNAGDLFAVSSNGGREPVLCFDDLNGGTAPTTVGAACGSLTVCAAVP